MLELIAAHITSLSIILGALITCFTTRKKIFSYIKSILRWFTAPTRAEKLTLSNQNKLDKILEESERTNKALFNGGSNGLVHQMDLIKAQCNNNFENYPAPMFICDNRGGNTKVNRAYRILVQIWKEDDIIGNQWENYIYGDLKENYIDDFEARSEFNEDFIGDVDFKNPISGEHRGRWKISAPRSINADGSCTYVGTFIKALDSTAIKIAKANKWNVDMRSTTSSLYEDI